MKKGELRIKSLNITNGAEIGFKPIAKSGETGIQLCNLVTINGSKIHSKEDFYNVCKYASFLATIQATYNEFPFLNQATNDLIKEDPLIGISIGGIMNSPKILLDPEVLKHGAEIVKDTNKWTAELLGINIASRTTCIKPKIK